jgi:hypothetical protein
MAIDRAVREMLDVEPPPGLRGRVLDGIELSSNPVVSAFRRKIFWIASPLAAAAIFILAVLLPSSTDTTFTTPVVKGGADRRLALTQPQPQPSRTAPEVQPSVITARTTTRPPRGGQAVATAAAEDAAADIVWVDPLAPPAAIAVAAIEPAQGRAMPSIDVAPAEIPALEIRPISDTPPERRNQE